MILKELSMKFLAMSKYIFSNEFVMKKFGIWQVNSDNWHSALLGNGVFTAIFL